MTGFFKMQVDKKIRQVEVNCFCRCFGTKIRSLSAVGVYKIPMQAVEISFQEMLVHLQDERFSPIWTTTVRRMNDPHRQCENKAKTRVGTVSAPTRYELPQ